MIYYIPFTYFFSSRAKTIIHKASFFILIIFPILSFYIAGNNYHFRLSMWFTFLLGFIGMFSIYEIGYIYNDSYTTRFEKNPSYWLVAKDREYIDRYFELLIGSRVVCAFASIVILSVFFQINTGPYAVALVSLYIIYAFHNTIRNRWNILTDFGLQILKYCAVLLLISDFNTAKRYSIMMIFCVPILRMIEFTNKKRLNLNLFNKIDVSILRIIYHFIIFIGAILLSPWIYELRCLTMVSLVLLIYRLASWGLLKNKLVAELRNKNFEDVK